MVAKLSLVAALVAAALAALAWPGSEASFSCFWASSRNLEKEYDEINAHLNEVVPAYLDVYAQLDRLANERETLVKSGGKRMASAVCQLVALKGLYLENAFCTERAIKLIEANDKAARNAIQRDAVDKVGAFRRVETIVLHFANEHARKCLGAYREEFKSRLAADGELAKLVELSQLIEPLIALEMVRSKKVANLEEAHEVTEKNPLELFEFVFQTKKFETQAISFSLKQVLIAKLEQVQGPQPQAPAEGAEAAPATPAAQVTGGRAKAISQKFNAKLGAACGHHVRSYGDLFEQANFDYKLLGTMNMLRKSNGQLDESEEAGQFLGAFMAYEACQKIAQK